MKPTFYKRHEMRLLYRIAVVDNNTKALTALSHVINYIRIITTLSALDVRFGPAQYKITMQRWAQLFGHFNVLEGLSILLLGIWKPTPCARAPFS
jgi:hypothetical protein